MHVNACYLVKKDRRGLWLKDKSSSSLGLVGEQVVIYTFKYVCIGTVYVSCVHMHGIYIYYMCVCVCLCVCVCVKPTSTHMGILYTHTHTYIHIHIHIYIYIYNFVCLYN